MTATAARPGGAALRPSGAWQPVFASASVGLLGGLIGLGGAEFRLPLLIGVFAALMRQWREVRSAQA